MWLEDRSSSDSLPKKLGIVDISGGDDWGMEGGGGLASMSSENSGFRWIIDNRLTRRNYSKKSF